jgi:hypothetical protein
MRASVVLRAPAHTLVWITHGRRATYGSIQEVGEIHDELVAGTGLVFNSLDSAATATG